MRFALLLSLAIGACATTSTTATTYTAEDYTHAKTGEVVAVRELVRETRGQPGAGAVAGGVVGGVLTGDWWGAALGAGTGALLSSGGGRSVAYDVIVRFDDGTQQSFRYDEPPPFRPGQPVALTPGGLQPTDWR